MMRHVGKIKNTSKKCVVVFMQVPGKEDHALVIETESLPMKVENAIAAIVESKEGQSDPVLGNILGRRTFLDTGRPILNYLHENGFLRTVHIDNIDMLPNPNMPFALRDIIEAMGGTAPASTDPFSAPEDKFNSHLHNHTTINQEEKIAIAKNLMIEAQLHQEDANRKMLEAYGYAPSLFPNGNPSSVKKVAGKGVPPITANTTEVLARRNSDEAKAPKTTSKTTKKPSRLDEAPVMKFGEDAAVKATKPASKTKKVAKAQ